MARLPPRTKMENTNLLYYEVPIGCVGFLLNFVEIIYIGCIKKIRRNPDTILLSLCLADLLTCTSTTLSTALVNDFSTHIKSSTEILAALSGLNAVLLSIDRFFAIIYPLKHRSVFTKSLIIKLIILVWVLGIAVGAIGFKYTEYRFLFVPVVVALASVVFVFVYTSIAITVKRRKLTSSRSSNNKTVIICLITTVLFVATSIPICLESMRNSLFFYINGISNSLVYFVYNVVARLCCARTRNNSSRRSTTSSRISHSTKNSVIERGISNGNFELPEIPKTSEE
uniref:G-protein coupled receptors family 1 profile domain-containing protein n=1 Tax=Clytia hemisphaerica TaxID=252671 RepID=A0A7M5WI92_9CNID